MKDDFYPKKCDEIFGSPSIPEFRQRIIFPVKLTKWQYIKWLFKTKILGFFKKDNDE